MGKPRPRESNIGQREYPLDSEEFKDLPFFYLIANSIKIAQQNRTNTEEKKVEENMRILDFNRVTDSFTYGETMSKLPDIILDSPTAFQNFLIEQIKGQGGMNPLKLAENTVNNIDQNKLWGTGRSFIYSMLINPGLQLKGITKFHLAFNSDSMLLTEDYALRSIKKPPDADTDEKPLACTNLSTKTKSTITSDKAGIRNTTLYCTGKIFSDPLGLEKRVSSLIFIKKILNNVMMTRNQAKDFINHPKEMLFSKHLVALAKYIVKLQKDYAKETVYGKHLAHKKIVALANIYREVLMFKPKDDNKQALIKKIDQAIIDTQFKRGFFAATSPKILKELKKELEREVKSIPQAKPPQKHS